MKPTSYLLLNCECNNDTMVVSYSPKTFDYFICCAQCGTHLATIPSFVFNYEADKSEEAESDDDFDTCDEYKEEEYER